MPTMGRDLEEVFLRPGDSVTFADRDDLLAKLDLLGKRVPGRRREGRVRDHREHFCMLRYLRFLAGANLLPLPVTLKKIAEGKDPPDFVLEWPDGLAESFELTDGSTEEYQKQLTEAARSGDRGLVLPVDIQIPDREAVEMWASILFAAFRRKSETLMNGRFGVGHLVIYDLTGLGLLVPLEDGARLLRREIKRWNEERKPDFRFEKVSILRDLALLLDLCGEGRLLRGGSPHFQVAAIRARDEADLRRRWRELDSYCRQNSIRYLKLFGSVLSDRIELAPGEAPRFRDDSDLDLLVEFELGTRVTLLDMARMERELSELIGFPVDLRTAGDLSRYFRQEVLDEAVSLHA